MLVRDLVQSTPFETNPVRVLLDSQVEGLPVLTSSDVVLLDEVCPLASVETSNHV